MFKHLKQCAMFKTFFYQEEPAATPVPPVVYSGLYGQTYSFDLIKTGKENPPFLFLDIFKLMCLFIFLFFRPIFFHSSLYIERLLDKRWVVIIDRDRTIDYVYCVDQQPAGD